MLVPSGPEKKNHLFTVALGPKKLDGYGPHDQVLMVSVTSVKPGFKFDDACPLKEGDHPYIKHDSYIYYREPRIEQASRVTEMVRTGQWAAKEPCDEELMGKILAGFHRSKLIPRHIRAIL